MVRLLMVAALLLAATPAYAVRLVVSIEPLAMLAEPLLDEGDTLTVLLPPNRSPHHYALRASDMRALQTADLVLWVGPELEQFLAKPLARHPAAQPLSQLPDLHWVIAAQGDGHHHGSERDPHLWLNPDNGAQITRWLAAQLIALMPERAEQINRRLVETLARLDQLTAVLEAQLAPLAGQSYIAYHPAYGHWNQRFNLVQRETVALTPEQKPGARHLVELRALASEVSCLVTEAFYDSGASTQLAAQLGLPQVVADPMGAAVAKGGYRYEQLLKALFIAFNSCLAKPQA